MCFRNAVTEFSPDQMALLGVLAELPKRLVLIDDVVGKIDQPVRHFEQIERWRGVLPLGGVNLVRLLGLLHSASASGETALLAISQTGHAGVWNGLDGEM